MALQPSAVLDSRFGDPGVEATDWSETAAALDTAQLFWITTIRSDGRPHVTPLVAIWLDGAAYFCTGVGEQKQVNVTGNPHVALTTGCSRWEAGLDVVVEGSVIEVDDAGTVQRLAERWAEKWDGRWQFDVVDGSFDSGGSGAHPLVYAVAPTKVIAFAKNPFSQTTYRFGA